MKSVKSEEKIVERVSLIKIDNAFLSGKINAEGVGWGGSSSP